MTPDEQEKFDLIQKNWEARIERQKESITRLRNRWEALVSLFERGMDELEATGLDSARDRAEQLRTELRAIKDGSVDAIQEEVSGGGVP